MKEHTVYKRRDRIMYPISFDSKKYNDLTDYAIYIRTDKSVLRIHGINYDSQLLHFNYITNPDIYPSEVELHKVVNIVLGNIPNDKYELPIIKGHRSF
jgi:hypothetical protein